MSTITTIPLRACQAWDRSMCIQMTCYCHDANVVPHYCGHCGCRPKDSQTRPDPTVAVYVAAVRWYAQLAHETSLAHTKVAEMRAGLSVGQLEGARAALRGNV